MPEGPVKKRKTSHGAAAAVVKRSSVKPEIVKIEKKSKKVVPLVEEESESESGEGEEEQDEESGEGEDGKSEDEGEDEVVTEKKGKKKEILETEDVPAPAAEAASEEPAIVKSFKELVRNPPNLSSQ